MIIFMESEMTNIPVEVYVPLLEEGTPTLRPTLANHLGGELYQILPTPGYDPEDEVWEFLPHSVVRCDQIVTGAGETVLRAFAMQKEDGSFVLSEDVASKGT
jgi:hypothetical protein